MAVVTRPPSLLLKTANWTIQASFLFVMDTQLCRGAYDSREKECFAVIWAILLLRPYLEGSRLKIRSDNEALFSKLIFANESQKLAHWRLCIYVFGFDIVHQAGIEHQAVDASLRLLSDEHNTSEFNDGLAEFTMESPIKAIDKKCSSKTCHMVDEKLEEQASELFTGSTTVTVTTLPTEPTTAKFLTLQARDPLCSLFTSTVGAPGFDIAYDCNRVLVCIVTVDGAIQKLCQRSLQAHFYTCITVSVCMYTQQITACRAP